jgi:hypothetical protein
MKNFFLTFLLLYSAVVCSQCNISVSLSTQTLTCNNPTILALASSTDPAVQLSWIVPGTPSVVNQASVEIGPATGPPTHSTALFYATYTVVATNTALACSNSSVISIYQNFRQPNAIVTIGSPSVITCQSGTVVLSLTGGGSTSGVPGALILVDTWAGPSPQATAATTQYSAYVPGTYSLTVVDSYNGCKTTKVTNVLANTQAPVPQSNPLTFTMSCGSPQQALITIPIASPTNGLRYLMINFPAGTAVSNNSFLIPPGSASNFVSVDKTGFFQCQVTNTVNGCSTIVDINVMAPGPLSQITLSPTPPTCSSCCDGSITFNIPSGFNTYSVAANMGTLTGNPPTTLNNLCYGNLSYTIANTSNNCVLIGSLLIDGTVSLREFEREELFLIYPNPAQSFVFVKNLSGDVGSLRVSSVEGKMIQKCELKEQTSISGLSKGIYFIELSVGNSVQRKKLIVTE